MSDSDDWPFDQARNCAAITTRQVLESHEEILAISHDEDDHGWQFIGSSDASEENGCLMSLEEVVEHDPSVLQAAEIPPGWHAVRKDANSEWQFKQQSSSLSDDPFGLQPGVTPKSLLGSVFQAIARLFKRKS